MCVSERIFEKGLSSENPMLEPWPCYNPKEKRWWNVRTMQYQHISEHSQIINSLIFDQFPCKRFWVTFSNLSTFEVMYFFSHFYKQHFQHTWIWKICLWNHKSWLNSRSNMATVALFFLAAWAAQLLRRLTLTGISILLSDKATYRKSNDFYVTDKEKDVKILFWNN